MDSQTLPNETIAIHSRQPKETVPWDQVYFPFASGRFAYDCVTCGAKCCKGFGYSTVIGPELDRQLVKRPHLAYFLQPSSNSKTSCQVRNLPPACFFLTESGRCCVHVEDGFGAKPETCRLFPFNDLCTAGDYLIAAPHSGLCPLSVVPLGSVHEASRHDALFGAMVTAGISSAVPRAVTLDSDVQRVIAVERQIVELSERFAGDGGYAAFAARSLELMMGKGIDANAPARSACAGTLEEFIRSCCGVLGLAAEPEPQQDTDVDRVMIAVTPYLRSKLIFRPVRARKEANSPSLEPARVPHVLIVLYLMTIAARRAGMPEITFQTVTRLDETCRDIMLLLANADRPMVWRENVDIDLAVEGPFASPFIRISRALLINEQARAASTLGEVLRQHTPFKDAERLAFLRFVSSRVVGKIRPLSFRGALLPQTRPALRHRIQRWGLQFCSDQTVGIAAKRALARKTSGRPMYTPG